MKKFILISILSVILGCKNYDNIHQSHCTLTREEIINDTLYLYYSCGYIETIYNISDYDK